MHTYILRVWINGIQPQESRYRVSGIAVPENWNGGAIWAGFFNISREIGMDDMNFNIIKSYDPYSAMRYIITMETWNRMLEYANKAGGDLQAALLEIKPWVDENFRLEKYFTIITI